MVELNWGGDGREEPTLFFPSLPHTTLYPDRAHIQEAGEPVCSSSFSSFCSACTCLPLCPSGHGTH